MWIFRILAWSITENFIVNYLFNGTNSGVVKPKIKICLMLQKASFLVELTFHKFNFVTVKHFSEIRLECVGKPAIFLYFNIRFTWRRFVRKRVIWSKAGATAWHIWLDMYYVVKIGDLIMDQLRWVTIFNIFACIYWLIISINWISFSLC